MRSAFVSSSGTRFDGNRLRLTGGTYGNSGATYQTEIETFSRITSYGTAGNGPQYFIVERKDGLIFEYGNTAESRIESVGQTTARTWAVNKIRDRTGNAVAFNYAKDTTNGAFRLIYIQYTSNSAQGLSPAYYVDFVYEDKLTSEIDSKYVAGSVIKQIKRLDRVDVYHNSVTKRRYELTYEPSLSSTSRSRLASVQECAGTPLYCYPATTFSYHNGTPGLVTEVSSGATIPSGVSPWPIDVNGDGRSDLVYSSSATSGSGVWMVMLANTAGSYNPPVSTTVTNTNFNGAIPIDYNWDGREDLLVPYSGGTWWVMLGNASGLSLPADTLTPTTATGTGANARAIDIDGDGREDLVWADLIGYAGGDAIRYRLRNASGGGFSTSVNTLAGPLPAESLIVNNVFAGTGQKFIDRAPDFNGDGRGDLAYRKTTRELDAETGNYFYNYSAQVICQGGWTFGAGGPAAISALYYADLNGDGKSDILYYTNGGSWSYRFSRGTSFGLQQTGPSIAPYGTQYVVLDWDSDGYEDLLAPDLSTGRWNLIRSTGEAFSTAVIDTGLSSTQALETAVTDWRILRTRSAATGVTGLTPAHSQTCCKQPPTGSLTQ